jgi:broad specificity phosphatase PhoE
VGREQALAVGARLRDEPIVAVYSSDLPRAVQTARAIAVPHGLVPIPEPGLRERNAGVFQGMKADDVVTQHPDSWEERARDKWGWSPPAGETLRQVLERALAVIDRLRERFPDGTVVVTTHMATKRALISHLAGIPIEDTFEMEFPSTGVSIFTFDGDASPTVVMLNDSTHFK